jgi:hypothetical protein
MLHYTTIDTPALELLKRLLAFPCFSNLRLAGKKDIAAMKLAAIADMDPQPNMLKKADWEQIKKSLVGSMESFIKNS